MSGDAANFDVDGSGSPLGGAAEPVACCLFDRVAGELRPLENVVCERIQLSEGPEPPLARFRYLLDALAEADGYPTRFERLWPSTAAGRGVVRPDDRIVVVTWTPHDERVVLFDGFAQIPQVDVASRVQSVTFTAVGVASRCFDRPIGRRLQRDADDPEGGDTIEVDLPVRFNPDGEPNRTPDDAEEDDDDPEVAHHVFLDERTRRDPDPRAHWTLADAAKYLIRVHNEGGWVEAPDFRDLAELLENRRPKDGEAYDPDDPDTYDADPIVVRDFDASNRPWPEALAELLSYAGFGIRWAIETDEDGLPENRLAIHRLDATGPEAPKPVDLDEPGAALDPARNNAEAFSLARDLNNVVNAFTLEVPARRVEASFILAPGFVPIAGDELSGKRSDFLRAAIEAPGVDDEQREAYRLYLADEAGDGHWDHAAAEWVEGDALDLAPIFPDDDDGGRTYVRRRRPGSSKLLSADGTGEPLRAQLAVSRNYAGPAPAVWDGTGDWQPIAKGWALLDDRLGILVTAEDPEAWAIGDYAGDDPQEASKTLRGITSQANPAEPNTRFTLRLTTVVDSDRAPTWSAAKRAASPTRFERRRRVDARDHFRLDTVAKSSAFAAEEDADVRDVDARDDTGEALAHAYQLRAAHERPPLVGSIRIPGLSLAYNVGDRIDRIRGRDASLRSDAAAGGREAPTHPRVARVVWTFEAGRATELHFTDRPGAVAEA